MNKLRRTIFLLVLLSTLVMSSFAIAGFRSTQAASQSPTPHHPQISEVAVFSHFAEVSGSQPGDSNSLASRGGDSEGGNGGDAGGGGSATAGVVNNDFNKRPQNEPAVAVNPADAKNVVVGANDYGIGTPIGGGVYFSFRGSPGTFTDYFPPFPLLFGSDIGLAEPPAGTGDPALAFGTTRAAGTITAGLPVVYYTSLGFSQSFCENGVFLFRSLDGGKGWTRPVVPPLAPPSGLRTVTYWPNAADCSVFNDKSYLAVDNSGGAHNGRIYVTWSKFLSDTTGIPYFGSPIEMAYSDNDGQTFSAPIEISGSSATLCFNPAVAANKGICNEDQFSSPVVGADGTLYVAFENDEGDPTGAGRDQYLLTKINPDTFSVQGPYLVASGFTSGGRSGLLADGINDYPLNNPVDNRQTICNSNFRLNSAGNLAIAPDGKLYVTFSDDRASAGTFPFPTFVTPGSFSCPAGKSTATGVFVSKSTDGGVTWKFLGAVSQNQGEDHQNQGEDHESARGDHWFPWVAVDPKSGKVGVVFYDRSNDPNNRAADTTLATSTNGGASWNTRTVSKFPSDFTKAFQGTGRFIGDYNNLTFDTQGRAVAVWTGMTPGKDTDIYISITSAGEG